MSTDTSTRIFEDFGLTEARADELITLCELAWITFQTGGIPAGVALRRMTDKAVDSGATVLEVAFLVSHITGHMFINMSGTDRLLMRMIALQRRKG